MGQHMRHSMDHIEPAITAALDASILDIHYDLRQRGRADEYDWDAAWRRLELVSDKIALLTGWAEQGVPVSHPLRVHFMLAGNSELEYPMKTTVARELGFAAHHAIHHMAMIKIIATSPRVGQLDEDQLPADFGRAPSTVNFDHRVDAGTTIPRTNHS